MSNLITTDVQLPLFALPGVLVPKLIHSGTDWVGQPYVFTDDSSVAIRTRTGQGILVDSIFGTSIQGPISLFESLENIHFAGGYFTMNPVQLESIGSSAALPIPTLVPSVPRLISAAAQVKSSVDALKAADPSIPQ